MTERDLMWLAGYLEGEGCFRIRSVKYRSPSVLVSATDQDVVNRAALLMGCPSVRLRRPTITGKAVYSTGVHGDKAIALMQALQPHMGARRRSKIAEVLALALSRPGYASGEKQGVAKLTTEAVQEIRRIAASGKHGLQSELARRYGVSQACIWFVIKGKSWKHLDISATLTAVKG